MRRRVFLSWAHEGPDALARVRRLSKALGGLGWDVWLDEEQTGHVCNAAVIQRCDCFAVCLTHAYCRRVQAATLQGGIDTCLRELLLATAARKPVLPICMDAGLGDPTAWGSVLCVNMGAHERADASTADARSTHRILCGLFSGGPQRRVLGFGRTARCRV